MKAQTKCEMFTISGSEGTLSGFQSNVNNFLADKDFVQVTQSESKNGLTLTVWYRDLTELQKKEREFDNET